MGIRTDGLGALLDALVESVERGGRGEDVAARAHVSRFHFDRLVTAAIGETPGAFRRRLLLERAAWTLACGGSVGEAAAAGGYDSPEAFARAFKRAFGVAPSRFEGGFLLPAPNGVHFHPPGSIVVPGGDTRRKTMDLTDRMLDHDVWLIGRLLAAAESLPEQELDAPVPTSEETLGSMLERLVWTKEMWLAAVEGRGLPERRPGSTTCLQKRLDEAGPRLAQVIRDARDRGAWDAAFVDTTCDPPESFTYAGMAAHVLTWSAYRRQLVLSELRRRGVEVDGADPLEWERSHHN